MRCNHTGVRARVVALMAWGLVLLSGSAGWAQDMAPPEPVAAPPPLDVQQATGLLQRHAWVPLAALLVHYVLRLSAAGVQPFGFSIPLQWRPLAALLMGAVAASLDMLVQGASWQAAAGGLLAALVAAALLPHPVEQPGDGTQQPNPAGKPEALPREGGA